MVIKKCVIKNNIIVKSTMRSILLYGFSAILTFSVYLYPVLSNAQDPNSIMPDEDAIDQSLNMKGVEQAASVTVKDGEVVLSGAPPSEEEKSKVKPKTEVVQKKTPPVVTQPKKEIVIEKPKPAPAPVPKTEVVEKITPPVVIQPKKEVVIEKPKPAPAPVPKTEIAIEKPKPIPVPVVVATIPKPVYISSLEQYINVSSDIENTDMVIAPYNAAMKGSSGSIAENISIMPTVVMAFNHISGYLTEEHNEAYIINEPAPTMVAAISPTKPIVTAIPTIASAKPIAPRVPIVKAEPIPPPNTSVLKIEHPELVALTNPKPAAPHITPVIVPPPKQEIAAEKTTPVEKFEQPVNVTINTPLMTTPAKPLIAAQEPKPLPPPVAKPTETKVAVAKPTPPPAPKVEAPAAPTIAPVQTAAMHLTPEIITPPKQEIAAEKPKPSAPIIAEAKPTPPNVKFQNPVEVSITTPLMTTAAKPFFTPEAPKPIPIEIATPTVYLSSLEQFANTSNTIESPEIIIPPPYTAIKSSAGSLTQNISITPSAAIAFNNISGFLTEEHNDAFIINEEAPTVVAANPEKKPNIDLTAAELPNNFFNVNILDRTAKLNTNDKMNFADVWKTDHPAYLLGEMNNIIPPSPEAIPTMIPAEENIVTESPATPSKAVIVHEVSAPSNPTDAYTNENLTSTSETIDYSAFDSTNEKGITIEGSSPQATPARK